MEPVTIFWFRRDLRIADNAALYFALKDRGNVLPLFIFDKEILDHLPDKQDKRISFILNQLMKVQAELAKHEAVMLIKYGKPADIFEQITNKYKVAAVYANHDYEPYATERDQQLGKMFSAKGIEFVTFKDQVIFEKDEVLKDDGTPYTVFTPYMKKWRLAFTKNELKSRPSETLLNRCVKIDDKPAFDLESTGFDYVEAVYPSAEVDHSLIANYDKTRDIPSLNGTSRLGVHLRFGTISIRRLIEQTLEKDEVFINELIWREFYMMILWHFPHVVTRAFKPQYDKINWINDEKQFEAWRNGLTGYPIVDAGMRQLSQTGYIHNRVRMITASFLTKHLLIDWRWGEAWFAQNLLDFELSSNNGGWQWVAGSGCDAAPYFRVFNPELQTKKFDPELKYIKKWVPEFEKASYPTPIVDHKFARERVLKAYKTALDG
jgi:deoxyribodipyrimidine photo-lyase